MVWLRAGWLKLPAVERRGVVAELAESGMSNRAIADVTGASRETVRRDLTGTKQQMQSVGGDWINRSPTLP
jgi:IS30 family transposase